MFPHRYICLCTLILALVPLASLFPQVDSGELSAGQEPVEFINYEGPQSRIETRAQIRSIGFALGQAVRSGASNTGAGSRYFVIHSVSDPEGTKLDADILGLGLNVGVDHIRNLRLIIQGYLEGAYAYSERDAATLAQFITIYNAVFRGKWEFWNSKYKTPVIGNLTPEKVGLSTRYDQWPGNALIVIPLQTALAGSLSAIDTSTLTEGEVIDELRQDDDRGIPPRRDMVDIKEREADQAEQKAAEQRRDVVKEEQAIVQDRQQNAEERKQIEEDRKQVQEDKEAGKITEDEAKKTEDELAAREAASDEKEEELAQREEALEEKREEAQKSEEFAEQKSAEAQAERQEIAQDQQGIINQEAAQEPTGILGMNLLNADSALGRLVRLAADSAEVLKSSAMNSINARTLTLIDGKILAVAGENRGNSAIRLVEINPATLEMAAQGDDDIHPRSLLWVNGSDIYAFTVSAEGLFLGRYNTSLARQARSSVTVHPFATVTFHDDVLVTQNTDGQAVVLNAQNLTERK
ncbi:P83/100 family protein [Treponema primitia]|uniref:P83/100 family protein n=1 Tax=Treponema primitia TaxID=88058 RepID=UPI0002555489|nr:P83/100 family protein [Treponema primitia]